MARRHGIEVVDPGEVDDVPEAVRELTGGAGRDAVIDAVGMEAHGNPIAGNWRKSSWACCRTPPRERSCKRRGWTGCRR